MKSWRQLLSACLAMLLATAAQAASISADSEVLAATAALTQALPASREFTVVTAGDVQIQLVDLAAPKAFTKLQLAIARGTTRVARLDTAGTTQFTAQPGTYRVHVTGTAVTGSAGTFYVEIRAVTGGALLLQYSDGTVGAPVAADPAQSVLNTSFAISQAGSYQVTLTDRNFPVGLTSVDLAVIRQGTGTPAATLSASGSKSFTVSAPGSYDLIVFATAAGADQAGLYSVAVSGGSPVATVYASTQPVGRLPAPTALTLPASGSYSLTLSDFAIPASLALLQAVVTQGATALAAPAGVGTTTLTASAGGAAQLYVFARAAASSGAGSFGLKLTQGTQTVLADARPVPEGFSATAGTGGYRYAATVPASANYQFLLRDYAFPTAFGSLRAAVSQGGLLTQSLSAASTLTAPLVAGPVTVLVMARPSAANANSLFGVSLTPQPAGAALIDATQGVGGLFRTRTVSISTAGSYDFAFADLVFPDQFTDLAVALTQGTNLVGQIFGGGKFTFTATPGTYSMNVLASLGNGINYGSWGYELTTTPPMPVVTLSASPTSVTAQQSTTLQWSATDATSCTATGGWTGAKAVTGSESVGPLSVDSTYNLACTGSGGTVTSKLTVSVTPAANSKGGGGAFSAAWLLALGLLLTLARREGQSSIRKLRSCSLRLG